MQIVSSGMKCQILFLLGKNISKCRLLKLLPRVLSANTVTTCMTGWPVRAINVRLQYFIYMYQQNAPEFFVLLKKTDIFSDFFFGQNHI